MPLSIVDVKVKRSKVTVTFLEKSLSLEALDTFKVPLSLVILAYIQPNFRGGLIEAVSILLLHAIRVSSTGCSSTTGSAANATVGISDSAMIKHSSRLTTLFFIMFSFRFSCSCPASGKGSFSPVSNIIQYTVTVVKIEKVTKPSYFRPDVHYQVTGWSGAGGKWRGERKKAPSDEGAVEQSETGGAVSYTHLTLPTKTLV